MRTVGIVAIFLLLSLIGVGYFVVKTGAKSAPYAYESSETRRRNIVQEEETPHGTSTVSREDIFSFPEESASEETRKSEKKTLPENVSVTYTAQGFDPAVARIRKGGTITFRNESGGDFQPASGETFRAENPIKNGGAWSFTFSATGTWGYSDSLNSRFMGVITVE